MMINNDSKLIAVICNPNAVWFEIMALDKTVIDFYLEHGFNVVLWNYWGYGKSEGTPTP